MYFERECTSASREGQRGREREREAQSGSKLSELLERSLMWGSNPQTEIKTWAQTKSRMLNWLSHPGTPAEKLILAFACPSAPSAPESQGKLFTTWFPVEEHISLKEHHNIRCSCLCLDQMTLLVQKRCVDRQGVEALPLISTAVVANEESSQCPWLVRRVWTCSHCRSQKRF